MAKELKFKKLHLGCGLNTPEGWINLDGSWNARLAKYPFIRKILKVTKVVSAEKTDIPWSRDILVHDVRKPLPFADNSLKVIYASHFLEHLYYAEAQRLLKDCFLNLEPGGIIRMVVPDLRSIVLEYINENPFKTIAPDLRQLCNGDRLNRRLMLRNTEPPNGNFLYRIYTGLMDFHSHKWMYDAESLTMLLKSIGFIQVQEMLFHQSRISDIQVIEFADRVLNGNGVCVEGIKPN